jgi:hypothetical protein
MIYGNAGAAHNAAISRMIVALGESEGSLSPNELKTLLENADAQRAEFYGWYNSTIRRRDYAESAEVLAIAADPIDVVSIISDWLLLQQENYRDQREALRRELNECKWRDWGQL